MGIKSEIQKERISIGSYLTAIFTWFMFFLFTMWQYLPWVVRWVGIGIFVFNILTLLGIKRQQFADVSKLVLERVLHTVQVSKIANVNDPLKILGTVEAGIMFLLDNWNEMWEYFKQATDSSKPADTNAPVAPVNTPAQK